MKLMKKLAAVLAFGMTAGSLAGCVSSNGSISGTNHEANPASMTLVGIAMDKENDPRGKALETLLKDAGYSIEPAAAAGDSETQITQIQAMLDDECSVLVIDPVDAAALEEVLTAADPSVSIITWDEACKGGDCLVTVDYAAMGKAEATFVLEELNLIQSDGKDQAAASSGVKPEEPPVYTMEVVAGNSAADQQMYDGAMSVLTPYLTAGRIKVLSGHNSFSTVAAGNAEEYVKGVLEEWYGAEDAELDILLTIGDQAAAGALNAVHSDYHGSVYPVVVGANGGDNSAQWLRDGYLVMSSYLLEEFDYAQATFTLVQTARNGGKLSDVIPTGEEVTTDTFDEVLVDGGIYGVDQMGTVMDPKDVPEVTEPEDVPDDAGVEVEPGDGTDNEEDQTAEGDTPAAN